VGIAINKLLGYFPREGYQSGTGGDQEYRIRIRLTSHDNENVVRVETR